ncbi:uncharacterized protein [Drosophila suzukii]|uniref:Uncharacterized protein isoform X3 n=1 Tax=Drosophila suzukii TaxID=28584 RepID=A0ABM4TR42_DROSZ
MPSRMQQCQQQQQLPSERRRTCRAISFSVVLPTKSDLEETKTIMTQKNPDDSSFVLLEFHNLTKWIKTSLHPDGVAF